MNVASSRDRDNLFSPIFTVFHTNRITITRNNNSNKNKNKKHTHTRRYNNEEGCRISNKRLKNKRIKNRKGTQQK